MYARPGRTSEAMNTVPPSHLSDSIVDTVSRPSFSLNVPAELQRRNGKLFVMLKQKWYSLIRPWIARYQRLRKRYTRLPILAHISWIPSVTFNVPEVSATISLSSLVHYMAEGWMGIGCIADPIQVQLTPVEGEDGVWEATGKMVFKNIQST